MKTWIALMVSGAIAASVTGCNTVAGVGKDIERGGEKIQDASVKVRSDWRNARDRNDRDYDAARAGCATGTDAQRVSCRDQARVAYTARMDADRRTYRRSEMRSESEQDRMEDAYESARDKCARLPWADEDRCVADARARYKH